MTKTTKIVLIVSTLLLASAGAVFAFRKKKPVQKAIKKVGSIIWPEGLSDSEALTETGADHIAQGDKGRYVEQLQDALNEIHKASGYINKNCNVKWGYFSQLPTKSDGTILTVTGEFDANTANVSQFYLNRKEVDLEYLAMIKKKVAAYKAGSDKCVYPLGIPL